MSLDEKTDDFWLGFPGIEDYEPGTLEDIQAFVQAAFRTFGLTWQSEKIVSFLRRVEEKCGQPVRSRHQLPFVAYQALAVYLAAKVMAVDGRDAVDKESLVIAQGYLTNPDQRRLYGESKNH